MDKNLFIVIPAYNEALHIVEVLESVRKEGYKNVIVVDDGSSDKTVQLAKEQGVCVISHWINRGVGAATQTGLVYARQQGASIVVTIDADGQHNVKDISRLVDYLISNKLDIVFGSRFLGNNNIPMLRRIFNKIADVITFLLSSKWVSDSQTGFKAFSAEALEKINIKTSGFEFCTEIFMQVREHKLKIGEYPVKVDYSMDSLNKGQNFATGITTLFKLFIEAITK